MKVNPNQVEAFTLPVLTVRGIVSFPNTDIRLEIGRLPSIEALDVAEANDTPVFLVTQKKSSIEAPEAEDLMEVGTIAKVTMKIKMPNGHYKVKFRPLVRAAATAYTEENGRLEASVTSIPSIVEGSLEEEALFKMLATEVAESSHMLFAHPNEVKIKLDEAEGLTEISDIVAFFLRIPEEDKGKYLETPEVKERLSMLLKDIQREKEIVEMELRINQEVKRSVDEHQKEFYLREKIRAIHKELGEENTKNSLVQEFKEKLATLGMPEAIEEKTLEEIQKFETMPSNSSEAGIVRTYIEWLLGLPWSARTEDNKDLARAEGVLNDHHYGLEKVKDRILEYLAVKAMTGKNPQAILCLVGPPGVGKTSLAQSIAEALGRKFVKISLGGVRDESEIRGHRRTYLGALPGRLIQGMKKAGRINPVFLLDEIDKMSNDYKGDPASAMLEVLDPEQNSRFSDHYLEEEYDLSQVLFIATANYLEGIPAPLKDRMDIISVSSYTEQEKFEIASRYLVKRQMDSHGLKDGVLSIEPQVIWDLVRYYTREAGVRQLERLIGALCRKSTRELLIEGKESITVDVAKLNDYLGARKFDHGLMEETDQVGVVTGLAYTQFGGDILPVEVTYYKGAGKTVLTGKLGDVMKESAQTAVSYVRANANSFGIEADVFKDNDIHIHVPEGAVPKDGPSAGITITTAVISALTGRSVRREVGMTGEVTLRGRVLPIGGLKEKSISAHRSGLKTIIMPKSNEKDLEDIPASVKDQLRFIPVTSVEEVLKEVLR
ncbi:MAG: endopeptidase La [Turicibacter sp.]|nr:endopeptidase La [Turicibacter sp.]